MVKRVINNEENNCSNQIVCANKIKGLLGFAKRAGKISFGFDVVIKDINDNKVKVVILSNDASERTAKKVKLACDEANIKVVVLPFDKDILGRSIGRDGVAVTAVTDKSFANRIIELSEQFM